MNFINRSSSSYDRIFIINLVIDFMEDDPYYKAFVRPTDNLPPQIKMNSSVDENLRPIFIDGSNVAWQ